MVNQVCYQVIGCDAATAAACEAGDLELNVMMPVIAWNVLHESIILREAMTALRARAVEGMTANVERCRELLDRSTAAATALCPYLGYAVTAEIAKASIATGRSIRDLVLERGLMDQAAVDAVLSTEAMTRPGIAGGGPKRPER
jgi:aspartate ammonia-lyase